MDHADARELLELAAVERDGLDRLAAGDTPEAAALAGHLAGCAACGEELERIRRVSELLRGALREEVSPPAAPPAHLRAQTLAYVREVGRARGGEGASMPRSMPASVSAPSGAARSLGWWVSLGAAVVLAAGLSGLVVSSQSQATIDRQEATISALARVNTWTLRVSGAPDARTVVLASTSGGDAAGTLIFSPSSEELVVVMSGLPEPPAGKEYRCWVEVGGVRQRVGEMYFGGDLGYWAGKVERLGTVPAGARFGVSLVDAADGSLEGDPVLLGTL